MAVDPKWDFDHDICPILTLADSYGASKKDSVLVRCRPDCAWYDTKDRRCVMMSLKVYLQSVDSVLNPEESKPTVAVELN